jgi:hypothetical protein
MLDTKKETPAPTTYKQCQRHEHLRPCEPIYDYTRRPNGVRVYFCSTHQRWIYEWPIAVTFTYVDQTTFQRVVQ